MAFETAADITRAIREGRTSAVEVCHDALDRIRRANDALHAFLEVTAESALQRASSLDAAREQWDGLPLLGVPVAVKDNICTRGIPTTAGSKILSGYRPPFNATAIDRLITAGAVIIGKTNCDEFAMGSSTENSAFGFTRNPWAHDRTPGGSSGGSAAAVAARVIPAALGSETGGSVRQPAALCGVVGVKPTYGRVSRFGLLAFASSLDQIGPIATTVADAATLLEVIAGPDSRDSTAASMAVPHYAAALTGDISGVRVGVPRRIINAGTDAEVLAAFDQALDVLRQQGASIQDVELTHSSHAIPVYYLLATAEASSNLARYDGVRYGYRAPDAGTLGEMYDRTRDEGFGPEVKRRIMLGTYVLSSGYYDAYYLKAQQVRTLIRRDYETAFESVDLIAMPTSPTAAFKLGERTADPIKMYLADVFTVGANLAGLPAISVPCGMTPDRLPVGLQLTGRLMEEAVMFRAADAFERVTTFARARPPA